MNKEELYKLALSDVPKYSLLNEIFAIRDTRYENQDYTINVNGYISLDVLNRYVKQINQLEKLTQENEDLEQLLSKQYIDGLRQGKFDNEMELINLKQINIELQEENNELKKDYNKVVHEATEFESKTYDLQSVIEKLEKWIKEEQYTIMGVEIIEYETLLDKLNELRSKNDNGR